MPNRPLFHRRPLWLKDYDAAKPIGRGRLIVGDGDDDACRSDVWDYETFPQAYAALVKWNGDGEPDGWIRHMPSGRRRPEGDPSREYVRA